MEVTDAVEILVFLIWQLLHGCYLAAKTARRADGDPFAKGSLAMLSALTATGPHGLPSRCPAQIR